MMTKSQTLLHIEKSWESEDRLWFVPDDFSSLQKRLTLEAQERTSHLQGIIWFSSSGSTSQGGIKFFGHTRDSLIVSARAVNEHLRATSQDRLLNPLPLYHVGGFGTWLRARLIKAHWMDASALKWSPSKFYQRLESERITITSLVPTQVHDLVALQLKAPPSLRAVVVGGGALASDLYFSARRLGWPLLPSYGMTEFGSQIATADLKSLEDTMNDFPDVKVLPHIVGVHQEDRGTFIQSEAACLYQLEMRPDHQFSLEMKKRREGVLVDDRLEYNSQTRVIKVLGRRTRVVKIKGELVSLDEVQRELQRLCETKRLPLKTHQMIVISHPHSRTENELVLMVEELQNFQHWLSLVSMHNAQAPDYKRISRVELVSELPKTVLGKIRSSEVHSAFALEKV